MAIASHRQDRTHLPPADECPLCPSRGGRSTEVPADDYDVVVFENRFPSFAAGDSGPGGPGRACRPAAPGSAGARSSASPATTRPRSRPCPLEHVRLLVDAWADRTQVLGALPHVEQVFCFENRGEEIGVTLGHPHGQIYAYPFVTPLTRRMLGSARRHRERTWRNLFADVLAAEVADGSRVVHETEHWVAFVPAAARWPVEVHLYPRRQVPDLPALDRRRAGRPGRRLPQPAPDPRRPVRRAAALHRRLAPGTRAGRPRPGPPAPRAVLGEAGRAQAQVPRRVGVRHGRVDQRRDPRAHRRPAAHGGSRGAGGEGGTA